MLFRSAAHRFVHSLSRYVALVLENSKWSVGHCLGVSGAVDVIAAAQMIKHKQVYRMANTKAAAVDPAFGGRYLTADGGEGPTRLDRVLVNSVGFGGMHGSLLLERA